MRYKKEYLSIEELVKEKELVDYIIELRKKNKTIGVIAEKISCFNLDEWKALIVVSLILKEKFTESQIKTATKRCFDPRYYTRHDIQDLYKNVGFDLSYLPRVPSRWKGITEWESENKKYQRLSSSKYSKDEYEFFKTRND